VSARGGRRYARRRGTAEGEAAILVVTEGEKTEPIYLEQLRRRLHLTATRIEVVQAAGTDPRSVVTSAIDLKKTRHHEALRGEGVDYSEVWVVFDSEHKVGTGELKNALNMARAAKVEVALSAPCFEYWLVLHFEYTTVYLCSYAETERRLKRHIPRYDKSEPPMEDLLSRVKDAVANASRCRLEQDKHGAELPRTDVDLLVTKMNNATREHHRLF
jgi:hypothetical protein